MHTTCKIVEMKDMQQEDAPVYAISISIRNLVVDVLSLVVSTFDLEQKVAGLRLCPAKGNLTQQGR